MRRTTVTSSLADVNVPVLVAVTLAPFAAYLFMRSVAHPLVEQISGKEYPKPRLIQFVIASLFILAGVALLLLGY